MRRSTSPTIFRYPYNSNCAQAFSFLNDKNSKLLSAFFFLGKSMERKPNRNIVQSRHDVPEVACPLSTRIRAMRETELFPARSWHFPTRRVCYPKIAHHRISSLVDYRLPVYSFIHLIIPSELDRMLVGSMKLIVLLFQRSRKSSTLPGMLDTPSTPVQPAWCRPLGARLNMVPELFSSHREIEMISRAFKTT